MACSGLTAGFGMVVRSTRVLLLAAGLIGAVDAAPADVAVLEGRILGNNGGHGVWLGVVGAEPETIAWTLVEGDEFKVGLPEGEPAALVAVAKDRIPLVVPLPTGEQRRPIDLRLARGTELDVQVRTDDGAPLAGARIAVVPETDAVFNALARTWFDKSLLDVTIDIAGDGRTAQVPPFAWPAWHTDREGSVRIAGLEAGPHLVQATLEGHVRVLRAVQIHQDAPNRLELALSKEQFVAGEVVAADGAAASGVKVTAHWHQHKGVDFPEPDGALHTRGVLRHAVVEADNAGAFRLGPFEAESHVTVFASSPASGSSARQDVLVPSEGVRLLLRRHMVRGRVVDAATGEPLERFRVRLDRASDAEHADGHFEVPLAPATKWLSVEAAAYIPHFARVFTDHGSEYDLGEIALDRERSITGRVRDAKTLQPVAAAWVRRSPWQYRDDELRIAASNSTDLETTDADGKFALSVASTRTDVLEVEVRGRRQLVRVPPDSTHVEIDLSFGSGVIAGSLLLKDGGPATGVVDLGFDGWRYLRQQDVGADGTFRWGGLEDGEYRIGAASYDGSVEGQVVTLRDGETVDGLVLTVDPAGRMTGSITGLFRNEFVTIEVRDRKRRLATTKSFRNGPFEMRGIPDRFIVTANTSYGRRLGGRGYLTDQGETRLNLDFSARSQLTGVVSMQGRPLAGIQIAIAPKDWWRPAARARTNDLGRYAAVGIANGPHTVFAETGRSFHVDVAGSTNLDMELPPNEVSGAVRAEDTGRVIAGAWVRLERQDVSPTMALRRQVASDGGFRFEGLELGAYLVHVEHPEFADVSRRVVVRGRQTILFRLKRSDP